MRVRKAPAITLALAAAGVAAASSMAASPSITWHFFQKTTQFQYTDSAGNPKNPNAATSS